MNTSPLYSAYQTLNLDEIKSQIAHLLVPEDGIKLDYTTHLYDPLYVIMLATQPPQQLRVDNNIKQQQQHQEQHNQPQAEQCAYDIINYLLSNHRDQFNIEMESEYIWKGIKYQVSPLLTAVRYGLLDIAKLLLQHGALVTATSQPKGWSILHIATHSIKPFEMASFLLDNYKDQLDLNHKTIADQITPLISSTQNHPFDVTKLFLQHGADPTQTDSHNNSILLHCCLSQIFHDVDNGAGKTDAYNDLMATYRSYENYYNNYHAKLDPTPMIDYFNYPLPTIGY